VFDCDFGRRGIPIYYHIEFDDAWRELAPQGRRAGSLADSIAADFPTCPRARENHDYIVSSTWLNNASIFEPNGKSSLR